MDRKEKILHWLTDGADLSGEPIPGQFLAEILGDNRLLIENHKGIQEYGKERIRIKCAFGAISVCGSGLEIFRMSKEQLIIRGRIDTVSLNRRNG